MTEDCAEMQERLNPAHPKRCPRTKKAEPGVHLVLRGNRFARATRLTIPLPRYLLSGPIHTC